MEMEEEVDVVTGVTLRVELGADVSGESLRARGAERGRGVGFWLGDPADVGA